MPKRPPKPLLWVGSSRDDLSALPQRVRRAVGFALRAAQNGEKSPDAKPLKGFGGAGVLEIVEDFDGSTYRAVYTVKFDLVVMTLHVFQKKSKKRLRTPKHEMEVIRRRLETAQYVYEQWKKGRERGGYDEE